MALTMHPKSCLKGCTGRFQTYPKAMQKTVALFTSGIAWPRL